MIDIIGYRCESDIANFKCRFTVLEIMLTVAKAKIFYCSPPSILSLLWFDFSFLRKMLRMPLPPPPPPRLRELEPRPAEFTAKRKWFSTFHEVLQFYTSTLLQFYTFSQLSCSKQRIRIFIFIQRRLKLISSV